jgi:hypothetical protein
MFKKSDNQGDKTPKQDAKDNSAKAPAAANEAGQNTDKTASPAKAPEAEKQSEKA